MGKYTLWTCAVVVVSLAIATVGYPDEEVMRNIAANSLTAINLQQSEIGGQVPLYAPVGVMEEESSRVKRHSWKKKAKKAGYYGQQSHPSVIIVNQYPGQYGGGQYNRGGGWGGYY